MAYRKYPWHRFQVWLRQQPDRRIAGYRDYTDENVLVRFLTERTGRDFLIDAERIYAKPPVASGPLPEWASLFLLKLEADSERPSYTFTTCRRVLREVSEELRYGQ